ncbi:hypothetical protein, partial [Mycobacterium avium]|uniref:hypothetical protein n=1 Tax=Mycobacterium avium TaxID=1764 RepID=UPI001CCBDF0B
GGPGRRRAGDRGGVNRDVKNTQQLDEISGIGSRTRANVEDNIIDSGSTHWSRYFQVETHAEGVSNRHLAPAGSLRR